MIEWRSWGASAFAEAATLEKPILLHLTAVWCHWCHLMDETTFSDPATITFINENVIPVRVDADQYPHVQDRYIAGGWPTNAFLAPGGEVLWSGTYVDAQQFADVSQSVVGAWNARRDELKGEIERRHKALETTRARHHNIGLVRRESADDILTATIEAYDERNGGFGAEPKFPYVDAIELLYVHGKRDNSDLLRMAEHSLDGMMAGEILDSSNGGFYRYALAADWTQPRLEKLLVVNAGMLRAYALGVQLQGRKDWRHVAEKIVEWAEHDLARDDGLWNGSNAAHDDVVYTSYNAQWIRSLALAGTRMARADWRDRAAHSFDILMDTMSAPDHLLFHFRRTGQAPQIGFLLGDALDSARAAFALWQCTNDRKYLGYARDLATAIERNFWAEDGGLWDRAKGSDELGALRYREKPFDANADAARLFIELALATGERRFRALAERILAMLSPQAGRHGVAAATYALAVDEFFEAPGLTPLR